MTWKPETRAAKNFDKIRNQIKLLEALIAFMKKNPRVAGRYSIKKDFTDVVLEYDEIFVIRPVRKTGIALQIERLQADGGPYEPRGQRVVHPDITRLSPSELDTLLKKLEIELDPYAE